MEYKDRLSSPYPYCDFKNFLKFCLPTLGESDSGKIQVTAMSLEFEKFFEDNPDALTPENLELLRKTMGVATVCWYHEKLQKFNWEKLPNSKLAAIFPEVVSLCSSTENEITFDQSIDIALSNIPRVRRKLVSLGDVPFMPIFPELYSEYIHHTNFGSYRVIGFTNGTTTKLNYLPQVIYENTTTGAVFSKSIFCFRRTMNPKENK